MNNGMAERLLEIQDVLRRLAQNILVLIERKGSEPWQCDSCDEFLGAMGSVRGCVLGLLFRVNACIAECVGQEPSDSPSASAILSWNPDK